MSDGFDAQRSLLDSGHLPRRSRSTDVLMFELRREILTPPWLSEDPAVRERVLLEICTELERRSIDVDSLIRWGLADRLRRAMLVGLLLARISERVGLTCGRESLGTWVGADDASSASSGGVAGAPSRIQWSFPIDDDHLSAGIVEMHFAGFDPSVVPPSVLEDVSSDAQALVRQRWKRIEDWIRSGSLPDLLRWRAASGDTHRPNPPEGVAEQYRWLIERLTVTYCAQWSDTSLRLEWRWARAATPPVGSVELMDLRRIEPSAIDAELARRTAGIPAKPVGDPQLDQVSDQALVLLRNGDFDAAHRLLEMAASAYPDDASATNNLGFVMIIRDPDRALDLLEKADELGYPQRAINLINRIQALLLLGRPDVALRLVEIRCADVIQVGPVTRGYLWSLEQPEIVEVEDPRSALFLLASAAAGACDDPSADEWQRRHDIACGCVSGAGCGRLLPGPGEAPAA